MTAYRIHPDTEKVLADFSVPQELGFGEVKVPIMYRACLLYTSPSPRDLSTSRMPSSA